MKVVLVLVCVCVANAMRISPRSGYGQYQDDSQDYGSVSPLYKNAVCFGLARRTRTQTVGVPFLYNTRTGQTAAMPGNLRHLDPAIVSKMDRDGWEVRTRSMTFARPIYFRVRVCCPWDAECRRRSMPVEQRLQSQAICENGGQLEVKGGVKVCVCPRGFRGQVCQYPDLIYRVQASQSYRGRPRQAPTPRHFTDMIRQTELWKQKMMTSQGRLAPSVSPPILSQKQHVILNSMSGPWGPRAAAWQQQAMKAKMAELCRRRRLLAIRNQRLQAEMMLAMQMRGGSPYAVRRLNEKLMQDIPVSPYSTRIMQQGARMSGPAYSTVSRRPMATTQNSGNPYSRVRPYVEPPQFGRPVNRAILHPEARTPWDMDPFSQNPTMMSDPRSMVHPLQYLKSVLRPEARTPWDMDPFQKNPALMRDPRAQAALEREKQLVALAYYRYMRNQGGNDVTTRPSMRRVQYPGPAPSPPVNGMDLSAQLPPMRQATPNGDVQTISLDNQSQMQNDLDLSIGDESQQTLQNSPDEAPLGPAEGPLDPTEGPLGPSEEEDTEGPLGPSEENDPEGPLGPSEESLGPTEGPLGPSESPLRPTEGRPLGPTEGPLSPMPMGPTGLPLGPAGSDMAQHMPSPVEMAKMEACRSKLEPEMDKCLTEYQLNFAQFMNPDYMALAKDVCVHSAVVGPCITSKDSVCGQGSQILLTRKMIQSVMQMMGMVCQQIMVRGDAPLPPLPSVSSNEIPPFKQSSAPIAHMPAPMRPMPVSTNGPETASKPAQSTNLPEATAEPTNQMPEREPSTEDTEIPALPPTEKPNHKKFDATKSGLKSKPTASPTVHSAEFTLAHHDTAPHDTSHDAAHPVSQQEMLLLGYPAWLVIALGGLLLLVFLLSGFVCCLCVRRRNKKSVELEVVPAPMDEKKLAIIGVPPPLYFTTAVNQTQEVDDLSLPPLELEAGEDSEDGEELKVNLEEDADDESDEKAEEEDKKERKKTKKDQQ